MVRAALLVTLAAGWTTVSVPADRADAAVAQRWSLTLVADRPRLSPGAMARVTATANRDVLRTPYHILIFDLDALAIDRPVASCGHSRTCVGKLTLARAGRHRLIAYVAHNNRDTFPPTGIQASTPEVVVTWAAARKSRLSAGPAAP